MNFKWYLSQIPLLFWSEQKFHFKTIGFSKWAVISVDLNCLELTQHRNGAPERVPALVKHFFLIYNINITQVTSAGNLFLVLVNLVSQFSNPTFKGLYKLLRSEVRYKSLHFAAPFCRYDRISWERRLPSSPHSSTHGQRQAVKMVICTSQPLVPEFN